MSSQLSAYADNEYVCAIYPIALFWEKESEICESKPLTVIFTILTRCLDTTTTYNYALRAEEEWSCENATQKRVCANRTNGRFLDNPGGSKLEGCAENVL